MPASEPYTTIGVVPEGGTFDFTAVLVDGKGKPLLANALLTLEMTLTDCLTGAIINGRDAVDVLNANGVTYDNSLGTGALEWIPYGLDNPFVGLNPDSQDGQRELHLAVFTWTWTNGSRTLSQSRKVFINVEHYATLNTPIEIGSGSDPVTLNFIGSNGAPLVGADVWVTSDDLGRVRVAGVLSTDVNGNVRFMLTNNTNYYLWLQSPNYTAINGQFFTAKVDQ